MSAYIVAYPTMNRVSSYIAKKRKIEIFDKDDNLTEEFQKLIKDLWGLNVFSLCERYGEKEKSEYDDYVKEYKFEFEKLPKEHFEKDIKVLMKYFKSFCNYTYQSCEGNANKTKLYKECQKYENELASHIATALPEWDEGEWE